MSKNRLHGNLGVTCATTMLIATILVGAGCSSSRIDDSVVRQIDDQGAVKAFNAKRKNAIFVDARPDAAYAQGHVPGAVNIRLEHLRDARIVNRLREAPAIIVYGQNPGTASAMALAKRLLAMGMANVELFDAGMDAWRHMGGRIVRGSN